MRSYHSNGQNIENNLFACVNILPNYALLSTNKRFLAGIISEMQLTLSLQLRSDNLNIYNGLQHAPL
ncbi:MAG: hypothetical protein KAJ63_11655 [Methyloprofundus sp.]|nr:hypothetical protein [Methyloprofundus sp.]